jgi:hypothetical protein
MKLAIKSTKPAVDSAMKPSLVERLLKALDFSPENVVQSASEQPRLFMQAAEYRMEKYRARVAAKMHRDAVSAAISLSIREDARQVGERTTEAQLEAMLLTNVKVSHVEQEYATADAEQEHAWLLMEAYRQRRDCLKIVADLVGTEIAMQKAVAMGAEKMTSVRSKLRDKWPS